MGALDFAGGAVVHINAGAAALALVLLIGVRKGYPHTPMPPHNLPLTMIGTGILWFGWAGFNAGSALAANGVAASRDHEHVPRRLGRDARLARRRAAQGGQGDDARGRVGRGRRARGDHAVRRLRRRHGAGLHRVRSPGSSAASPCAQEASFKFDDSLDVVAVHLVGGLVGSILLGLLRRRDASTPSVTNEGLFLGGGTELLIDQIVASVVTLGVLVRRHLDHRQGDRPDDGPPGRRGRRGRGARPEPARRDRLRELRSDPS